jgi:Flp pilus assembly protein TadG
MRVNNVRADDRGGAAAVEMAFCLIPLFTLIFGIFEYGRFMMDRNLMDNAVRAGCRMALAHNTDANLLGPGPPYINGVAPSTTVQDTVTRLLGGRQTIDLVTAPTIANGGITVTGSHYNTATQAWQSVTQATINTLGPGDKITVSVTATYKFILPIMIYVPSTVPLNSSVTMLCEGGN